MNPLRPLSLALTAVTLLGWSAPSPACDQDKARGASATNASVTASKAVACTEEMAKTCTAAAAANCPMKGTTAAAATAKGAAKSAAFDCCAGFTMKATTAARTGPSAEAIDAEFAGACAAHGANATAVTASSEGACAHGAKATAVTASSEGACPHGAKSAMASGTCAAHGKVRAVTAGANGSCAPRGAKNAVMAAEAPASCGGRGILRTSGQAVHPDCEACMDMQACETALRKLGASMQVVSLKNGVMYVYTADANHIRSVQQELSHRRDQMALFTAAGSSAHLCPDCRQMRGAAMSGKLTTEVVNVDGRCVSLMTSSDPTIVARIHALAGLSPAARAKL